MADLELTHLDNSPGCTFAREGEGYVLDARKRRADRVCGMVLAASEYMELPKSESAALRLLAEARYLAPGEAGVAYAGPWLGIRTPGFKGDEECYPFGTFRLTHDNRAEQCVIEGGLEEHQRIHSTTPIEGLTPDMAAPDAQRWQITAWWEERVAEGVLVLGLSGRWVGTWRLLGPPFLAVFPYVEDAQAWWRVTRYA